MWKTLISQRTGSLHLSEQKQCQNAYLIRQGEKNLVLTVADGYGDLANSRNRVGAELACRAGCEVLSDPAVNLQTAHIQIKIKFDELVSAHLAAYPLTSEEWALLQGKTESYAYGTTLMCVLLREDGVYRLQVGAGKIYVLNAEGKFLPELPRDASCWGNRISSLVDPLVLRTVRWDFTPEKAGVAILHTDGYAPAGEHLLELLTLPTKMPEAIPEELCRNGDRGDDQTILVAACPQVTGQEIFPKEQQKEYWQEKYAENIRLQHNACSRQLRQLICSLADTGEKQERKALIEMLYQVYHQLIALEETNVMTGE